MKVYGVYVYQCEACEIKFAVLTTIREEDVYCPTCCRSSELSLDREEGFMIRNNTIFGED